MRYPIVIDGRNLYDPAKMMLDNGFTYLSIGTGRVNRQRSRIEKAGETV